MIKTVWPAALLVLGGCGEPRWDPVTFSCQTTNEKDETAGSPRVYFHYEEGFLFLRNDQGMPDNVCTLDGTVSCDVKTQGDTLSVRQAVEDRFCDFRSELRTELDVNRTTGAFRLSQEACDPKLDQVFEGTCTLSRLE